jgi:hypothetical protein
MPENHGLAIDKFYHRQPARLHEAATYRHRIKLIATAIQYAVCWRFAKASTYNQKVRVAIAVEVSFVPRLDPRESTWWSAGPGGKQAVSYTSPAFTTAP